MPKSLHDAWKDLVEAIRVEVYAHGQHPDVLEVDETALKIRLPVNASTYHSERFLPEAVVGGRPAEMATRFYQRYQETVRDEGQAPV